MNILMKDSRIPEQKIIWTWITTTQVHVLELFLGTITIHFYICTEVIVIENGYGQNDWSNSSKKNTAPLDK